MFNNITIIKTRFQQFSEKLKISRIFFKCLLYTVWLYSLQFITCKIGVNAFILLYSKGLFAKLCLFVFVAIFAASHCQFDRICSCFIYGWCLPVVKRSWPKGQGVRLQLSRSLIRSPYVAKFYSFKANFYLFLFHFCFFCTKLLFCCVPATVCEALPSLCVNLCCAV